MTMSKGNDPFKELGRPMTRARVRKAKEALQQVLSILFYNPNVMGKKELGCELHHGPIGEGIIYQFAIVSFI